MPVPDRAPGSDRHHGSGARRGPAQGGARRACPSGGPHRGADHSRWVWLFRSGLSAPIIGGRLARPVPRRPRSPAAGGADTDHGQAPGQGGPQISWSLRKSHTRTRRASRSAIKSSQTYLSTRTCSMATGTILSVDRKTTNNVLIVLCSLTQRRAPSTAIRSPLERSPRYGWLHVHAPRRLTIHPMPVSPASIGVPIVEIKQFWRMFRPITFHHWVEGHRSRPLFTGRKDVRR